MCGIAGIVSRTSIADRSILLQMRDSMVHRGPDDAGDWWSRDGKVGLAHRRLSIVDLTPSGHQPMQSDDGSLIVVFNGEIYNYPELRKELEGYGHRFRSHSDTEVLLVGYRQWAKDLLCKLNGMFAFSIFDSKSKILFCARDRAGEKPFFFRHWSEGFVFASELKGLMKHPATPRKINQESAEFYFAYGNVPGANCILEGVRKLPPAHALQLDIESGNLREWRYWDVPIPSDYSGNGLSEDLVLEFESLLEDSVRRQLVADVPVGILLSGGIDSSLVTAMASRTAKSVKTFTISFPGHGKYDETPFARLVANYFGTQHTELVAESATVELLPELARQFDEPMCDSSMIPTFLVSRLIKKHCTVALGGDGGDELFGGYMQYSHLQLQQRLRRYLPRPLRALTAAFAKNYLPMGFRGRNYFLSLEGEIEDGIANVHCFFDQKSRLRLLPFLNGSTHSSILAYKRKFMQSQRGMPGMAMAADFQTYLPDDILVKVDRASMLNSLEIRAPFLDHRIIEFAFEKVPNFLRAGENIRKILPMKLAEKVLPKELDLKRKQGFSIPLHQWFKGSWGAFITDVLNSSDTDIVSRKEVNRLLDGQRKGYSNTERLFALTLFELWRREYRVSIV